MFVALFAGLAVLRQTPPKTFVDVELAKVIAFHGVPQLHVEYEADLAAEDPGKQVVHSVLWREGKKSHTSIVMPTGAKIEIVDDGTNSYFMLHSEHAYWVTDDRETPPFDAQKSLLHAAPSSFNMNVIGLGPLQFASDPPPQIDSMGTVTDSTGSLRKVVASATGKQGHRITVTQWLLPDRWFVKRAEIEGTSNAGPIKATIKATVIDFHPAIPPREFVFSEAAVAGYTKGVGAPPIGQ